MVPHAIVTGLLGYTPVVGLYVLVWFLVIVSGIAGLVGGAVWVSRRLLAGIRPRRAQPG